MKFELPPLALPGFPQVNLSWLFSSPLLIVIFILFSLIYAIITVVLFYHWYQYGMKHRGILIAEALFVLVSFVCFGVSLTALNYI